MIYSICNLLVANLEYPIRHGLRTPDEEITFTARPKIHSHSQVFRYSQSTFCLPYRFKFSDFFVLCLHWVSVVSAIRHAEFASARSDQIFVF